MSQNGGPARLLLNEVGQRAAWVGLTLVDANGRRHVPGTRVEVPRRSAPPLWRWVTTAGSYASASDPRLLIGLGEQRDPVALRVGWPSGQVEAWDAIAPGRYTTLVEGEGKGTP